MIKVFSLTMIFLSFCITCYATLYIDTKTMVEIQNELRIIGVDASEMWKPSTGHDENVLKNLISDQARMRDNLYALDLMVTLQEKTTDKVRAEFHVREWMSHIQEDILKIHLTYYNGVQIEAKLNNSVIIIINRYVKCLHQIDALISNA